MEVFNQKYLKNRKNEALTTPNLYWLEGWDKIGTFLQKNLGIIKILGFKI